VIEEMSIDYFGGMTGTQKIELLGEKPSQCHSVHHKSHTYCSGIKPATLQKEAGN